MRTTINIDDQLLIYAKHQAVEQGITLANVIENALRQSQATKAASKEKHEPIRLITATGTGVKPGIDLDNSRSLLDIMDH